jgi:hypothetical protein
MEFQKNCWGGPSALEVLMVGLLVGIPLLLRFRRQGFLLPAASFPFLSPEQFDAVFFAMFVEGAVHASLLGIALLSARAALARQPLPALSLSKRTRNGPAEGRVPPHLPPAP